MDTDTIDTTTVDQARTTAEQAEQRAADARRAYYEAVADLARRHGATAAARALGVTRARIYQLAAKLDDK